MPKLNKMKKKDPQECLNENAIPYKEKETCPILKQKVKQDIKATELWETENAAKDGH